MATIKKAKTKTVTEKLGNIIVMYVEVGKMPPTKAKKYMEDQLAIVRSTLDKAGDTSHIVAFPMRDGKRMVQVEILPLHI
jgi:hypothetical protein